jgi:group I intron endonuclease
LICIYAIINIVDDKHYIGQASDRDFRWKEHLKSLRGFYHHSILLQRAWCKHGANNFIFVVLEVLSDTSKLNEREIYWGKLLKPEYNIAPLGGSMRGYEHTEEARLNMSNAHKGKKHHSEEHKKRLAERMKGNTWNVGRKHSAEHIETRAKAHRGKIISEETKIKMSLAQKGRKLTEEHKQKLSVAKKGKNLSDNHKKKLSEAAKKQWERQLTNQQILNSDGWKSSWSD